MPVGAEPVDVQMTLASTRYQAMRTVGRTRLHRWAIRYLFDPSRQCAVFVGGSAASHSLAIWGLGGDADFAAWI